MIAILATSTVPGQFFTLESMLTLTGATGATFVISNGLQRALNFNPKWLALAIALALTTIGVYLSNNGHGPGDYFVGVVNGFLVYCTAVGSTAVAAGDNAGSTTRGNVERGVVKPLERRGFLTRWF